MDPFLNGTGKTGMGQVSFTSKNLSEPFHFLSEPLLFFFFRSFQLLLKIVPPPPSEHQSSPPPPLAAINEQKESEGTVFFCLMPKNMRTSSLVGRIGGQSAGWGEEEGTTTSPVRVDRARACGCPRDI